MWPDDPVSIHARSRRTERPEMDSKSAREKRFNPRPVPKDRATYEVDFIAASRSFNPRPVPKDRATGGYHGDGDHQPVSIHARSRRTERPGPPRLLWWSTAGFNPRPVPKDRATRLSCSAMFVVRLFQSTPGPEGPSDDMVTILHDPTAKFQSTPGPEGPSDTTWPVAEPGRRCFNPRPVPKDRATVCSCFHPRGWKVSIHARSRRTERRLRLRWPAPCERFQSTPGPEGPSDMV